MEILRLRHQVCEAKGREHANTATIVVADLRGRPRELGGGAPRALARERIQILA